MSKDFLVSWYDQDEDLIGESSRLTLSEAFDLGRRMIKNSPAVWSIFIEFRPVKKVLDDE